MKSAKKDFVFKKHMSIGEADAEADRLFLEECFEDIGDIDVLLDSESSPSIVIGRTGAGKSALLERLEEIADNTIRIEPEELALRHISNSTVLQFFENLGVDLDIFYSLLWQHTFAVELIKSKYKIQNEQESKNYMQRLKDAISGDKKKQQALDYIEEWGDKFWVDTETRIKNFTEKMERDLKTSLSSAIPGFLNSSTIANIKLSDEQRCEVIHYGKKVVNSVQIEKLSRIINLLSDDIFTDNQQKTYIVIDRLDENWVEDELRYKLIRALIETIKKFRKIKPVKIVITLRVDLLNRVLEKNQTAGFQPEKYNSLYLKVGWNKSQLKSLLDKRINFLLKEKYTNSDVRFDDIFPNQIEKTIPADYILDRTLLRPRDAIMFINFCLIEAQGKTEISGAIVKKAEQAYSQDRISSLKYEWKDEHPKLEAYMKILHKKHANFRAQKVLNDELIKLVEDLADTEGKQSDLVTKTANRYLAASYPETEVLLSDLRKEVLFTLYKIGAVGIKVDGISSVKWVHDRTQDLTSIKIETTSIIYIHKMLWRALAVDKR